MKMKMIFAGMLSVVVLAVGGMTPVMAIGDICSDSALDGEQRAAAGCDTNKVAGEVANDILQLAIGLMGLIAVGVMLYGGVIYVASTGDAGKVMRAKRTITYGLVGLAVCLLAFAIVRFVSGAL